MAPSHPFGTLPRVQVYQLTAFSGRPCKTPNVGHNGPMGAKGKMGKRFGFGLVVVVVVVL